MRIGQVAREAGVSVQTVRLYEREGLIPSAERLASGYREYLPSIVDHVRAVKHGQRLGFTLAEMKIFVDLHQPTLKSHEALALFLREKIIDLDARITQLSEIRSALSSLATADYNWNVDGDCPVIHILTTITVRVNAEIKGTP